MKVVAPPVRIAPSNNSVLAAVVSFPLFGDVLFPCAATVASSEPHATTPEYSRITKRSVDDEVSDTVTVLAPPAMFSA